MLGRKLIDSFTAAIALRIWLKKNAQPFLRAMGWEKSEVSNIELGNFEFQEAESRSDGVAVQYANFGSSSPRLSKNVVFPLRIWKLRGARVVLNTKFAAVRADERTWINPRFEIGPYFLNPTQIPETGSQIRAQADNLVLQRLPRKVRHLEEAIYCGTRVATNWGHWLMNFLPGVMLAADAFSLESCPPLIVPIGYREGESRRALFDLMWSQRPVTMIDATTAFEITRLHWVEQPVSDSPRPRQRNLLRPKAVNIATLSRFRQKILDFAGVNMSGGSPWRSLFLAREAGSSRAYDYDRVHQTAQDRGFEVVFLNRLNFVEQIKLVYSARRIVAPDGSALACLLFTHPLASSVVLTRVDDSEDWFAFGAEIAGSSAQVIRHTGYDGKAWGLDPAILNSALQA